MVRPDELILQRGDVLDSFSFKRLQSNIESFLQEESILDVSDLLLLIESLTCFVSRVCTLDRSRPNSSDLTWASLSAIHDSTTSA